MIRPTIRVAVNASAFDRRDPLRGRQVLARRPFEIHGTLGNLVIENSFTYLTGRRRGPDAEPDPRERDRHYHSALVASECFRLEVEHFKRAITGQGQPTTSAQEGPRILEIGEALLHRNPDQTSGESCCAASDSTAAIEGTD